LINFLNTIHRYQQANPAPQYSLPLSVSSTKVLSMKRILLLSCLCLPAVFTSAQSPAPTPENKPKPELGIFGQADGLSDDKSLGMLGLHYQRWHNEHLSFRVMAAYGNYYSLGPELHYVSGDTGITKRQHYNVSLPIAGFGLQAQRHFYKNIYLFATAELSGGYGSGIADTSVSWSIGQGATTQHIGQNEGRQNASLLYGALTAAIGAKVQWSRFSVGLEVSPIHATYTQLNDGRNTSNADFTLGSFSHRLYIHWRL
jgi:hypothetical protein